RLAQIVPSQGTPFQNDTLFLKQTFVLSTTSQQINQMSAFVPSISKGKIRVKIFCPSTTGVSPAVSSMYFILDDGTTYVEVGRHSTEILTFSTLLEAPSIPLYVDRVIEFEVDINATELSIASTLTGTNPILLLDVEISGT